MDLTTLQPLLDWIAAHPTWAGVMVFVIACGESLAVVGLFVPGALLLFGAGALVAGGELALWPILAWAVAGAVLGDGVSFWLGYHYKQRLRELWPFRNYPKLMSRGESFFFKHGGKSIAFGRFVGPVRPIVPAVAGMLGMSPLRFVLVNVASALLWAPAYILPGVVVGASLGLASQVATRLVVLLVGVMAALWFTAWLVYRIARYLQPRTDDLIDRLLAWAGGHRVIGQPVAAVLNPERSETRALLPLAILLLLMAWGLITLGYALSGETLTHTDLALANLMEGLRAPWADKAMVLITGLGDPAVLGVLTGTLALWLAGRRRWLALLHWLGATGFAWALAWVLQQGAATPLHGLGGPTWNFAHVPWSTAQFGLLAVLVAAGLRATHRWLPYSLAGSLIVAVAMSRWYLGGEWFSHMTAGLMLSLLWVTVLGGAYRRHAAMPLPSAGLTLITVGAMILAGTLHLITRYDAELAHYQPRYPLTTLSAAAWWHTDWRTLPSHRLDLEGEREQTLSVQWAGELADIRPWLEQQGWHAPPPLTPASALQWLRPEPPVVELPLLPQVHHGRHEYLLLVRPTPDDERFWSLRLWNADHVISPQQLPLWLGTVTAVHSQQLIPWITTPVTGAENLSVLEDSLAGQNDWEWRRVKRLPSDSLTSVILIRPGDRP